MNYTLDDFIQDAKAVGIGIYRNPKGEVNIMRSSIGLLVDVTDDKLNPHIAVEASTIRLGCRLEEIKESIKTLATIGRNQDFCIYKLICDVDIYCENCNHMWDGSVLKAPYTTKDIYHHADRVYSIRGAWAPRAKKILFRRVPHDYYQTAYTIETNKLLGDGQIKVPDRETFKSVDFSIHVFIRDIKHPNSYVVTFADGKGYTSSIEDLPGTAIDPEELVFEKHSHDNQSYIVVHYKDSYNYRENLTSYKELIYEYEGIPIIYYDDYCRNVLGTIKCHEVFHKQPFSTYKGIWSDSDIVLDKPLEKPVFPPNKLISEAAMKMTTTPVIPIEEILEEKGKVVEKGKVADIKKIDGITLDRPNNIKHVDVGNMPIHEAQSLLRPLVRTMADIPVNIGGSTFMVPTACNYPSISTTYIPSLSGCWVNKPTESVKTEQQYQVIYDMLTRLYIQDFQNGLIRYTPNISKAMSFGMPNDRPDINITIDDISSEVLTILKAIRAEDYVRLRHMHLVFTKVATVTTVEYIT